MGRLEIVYMTPRILAGWNTFYKSEESVVLMLGISDVNIFLVILY